MRKLGLLAKSVIFARNVNYTIGLRRIYAFSNYLALHSAGAVAARESFYLFTGNEVEVTGDCVL